MNAAERVVLTVLAPGGVLTAAQIRRAVSTGRRTRAVLTRLHAAGLIVPDRHRDRWQLGPRGRDALPTPR